MSSIESPEITPLLQEQEPLKKRTGIIVTVVSVVLVAAIATVAVLLIKNSQTTGSGSASITHTTYKSESISLGKELVAGTKNKSATQVDIYFDYSCSHCNHLSTEYGADLGEAAQAGDITLVYHPVAIMGTLFSYTGAGAEFFVVENEPDKYFAFHELLHANVMTPYMNGEITNPRAQDIVNVAREAGVSDENCEALLQELTEMEDVLLSGDQSRSTPMLEHIVKTTNQFLDDGGTGTPTVYIDDVKADNWTQDILNLLDK